MPTAWLILMNSRLSAIGNVSVSGAREMTDRHTLGAAANELRTLPDEVLRDIGKLLQSLRHDCEKEGLLKKIKELEEE